MVIPEPIPDPQNCRHVELVAIGDTEDGMLLRVRRGYELQSMGRGTMTWTTNVTCRRCQQCHWIVVDGVWTCVCGKPMDTGEIEDSRND